MVITFFGHSSTIYSDIDEKRLLEQIEKITKGNDVDFYLGGYGNFDALAKNCAKQYRYPVFEQMARRAKRLHRKRIRRNTLSRIRANAAEICNIKA